MPPRIANIIPMPFSAYRRVLCRLGMLFGGLLLASCVAKPPAVPDTEIATRLGDKAPFLPLYRALEAHAGPVTILQIGDSHTANDAFSGRMRELFQQRFGDGGRGFLPPGIPFKYYHPAKVTVTAEGWTSVSSFRPGTPGPFGITGLRQHAEGAASMSLSVVDPADLSLAEIEVVMQPGGGAIELGMDNGRSTTVSTAASAVRAAWFTAPAASGSHILTMRALGDGPVDVLGWRVERHQAGVVYANLGTIGATADLPDRWSAEIVGQELDHLSPALIVFAFGTNEGFRDSTDPVRYAEADAARLTALRRQASGAALLIVGPPEGERQRKRAADGAAACGDPQWMVPPRLDAVREAERTVAARIGAAFWDWRAAMGGPCTLPGWVASGMAAKDRVHLLTPGYRATADKLFQMIMDGYDQYRALRTGA